MFTQESDFSWNLKIKLDKKFLDFGQKGAPVPLNKTIQDKLKITCISGKVKFQFEPYNTSFYTLQMNPDNGVIKKKQVTEVTFLLTFKTTLYLKKPLKIEVQGSQNFGHHLSRDFHFFSFSIFNHFFCKHFRNFAFFQDLGYYFIFMDVQSEKTLFGVDPSDLESVETNSLVGKIRVPAVLNTMGNYLRENNGLHKEGIFRNPSEESEVMEVKEKLSKKSFSQSKSVDTIANLLKIWFRELPKPLFYQITVEELSALDTAKIAQKRLLAFSEPYRSTSLLW